MQINISGHHLDITPAIHSYSLDKVERLQYHNDFITRIDVTLSVDKLDQKAEALVHVSGKDIYAESVHTDLYAAIDALADKLDRQLIKHKEKLRNHR